MFNALTVTNGGRQEEWQDSKGHEPRSATATTRPALIKSRFNDEIFFYYKLEQSPGSTCTGNWWRSFTVPAHKWILMEHFFGLFTKNISKPVPAETTMEDFWTSPEGFIKYCIWRSCERGALRRFNFFKLKGILTKILYYRACYCHHCQCSMRILHFHNKAQEVRAPLQMLWNTLVSNPQRVYARRALLIVIIKGKAWKMSAEISLLKTSLQIQLIVSLN